MTHDAIVPDLLRLRGITKQYPNTLANDRVDLTVAPGEIHALLGENGAGKSTLVKIIYGVVKQDAGDILWNGTPVEIPSPHAARTLGVGMVFQHFSLFEGLTVAENLALGMNERLSRKDLRDQVADISTRYGLPLDPSQHVSDLSLGERQRIEIVRCLMQSPKLLIMDEPTSVLTPQEVEKLFLTLRQLAAQGCSILYISHKLKEIKALCQAATVMRGGKVVAHCDPRQETTTRLAELMIGETLAAPRGRSGTSAAAPCLDVSRLTIASERKFGTDLKAVSFAVSTGQILGIAGVAGNGQTELMDALSGEIAAGRPETITIDGVSAGTYVAERATQPWSLFRAGGTQRPCRRARHDAVRERFAVGLCPQGAGAFRPDRQAEDDGVRSRTSSRASMSAPAARWRKRGRCPAATCKSLSWVAKSSRSQSFWW